MTITSVATPLTGKTLRWVVCLLLRDNRKEMSISEIVIEVRKAGYEIAASREGKAISDALRWEVQRGRVVLVRRGVYARGFMQRSTEYSMRERVARIGVLPQVLRRSSLVAESAADRESTFSLDASGWDGPIVPINLDDHISEADDIAADRY